MPRYFDMEVSLRGIAPRIWRRFLLRSTGTFFNLHLAIQKAGGWGDYHLFAFLKTSRKHQVIAAVRPETYHLDPDRVEGPPAGNVPLASHFKRKGGKCIYLYDFGDRWEHLVELKQSVELTEEFERRLVGGARAFPSEDCGGIGGYQYCLTALKPIDPEEDEAAKRDLIQRRHWLGNWRPEAFDLASIKGFFDK